jgi:hypothetical protein
VKAKRSYFWAGGMLLGLLTLLLLLPLFAGPTRTGAFLIHLPLGWWHFLGRNVHQITVNWSLIGTWLICSVLVVVVGNFLLRALFSQFQHTLQVSQPPRRWRWRWTICIYCGIWLLFAIAFGAAGVLRHTTWLMENHQPWYQERMNYYAELRMADGAVQQLLLENSDDLESTRKAFAGERSNRRQRILMADEFNVIFYGDKSNKVAAYLIIPRLPQLVTKARFGASIPGTNDLVRPLSDLQKTIAELDAAYPPLLQ